MVTQQGLSTQPKNHLLWDLFCIASLVGIWPRFIEPKLILTTRLNLKIPNLPEALQGLKVLQLSDLHLNANMSDSYLDKLVHKSQAQEPDIIVLTGDFLCYGQLLEPARLKSLLKRFSAPYGCYAILGNHDYAQCVSINTNGDYDVIPPATSSLGRAFSRLKDSVTLTKTITERAKRVPLHSDLLELIASTPFKLLHNSTEVIEIKDAKLNICGLGEHALGKLNAHEAYKNYDKNYPGLILLHNPDGAPHLSGYPGEIILSGHTHGGQVNLPWIWKKFTLLENMQFKKGFVKFDNRRIYINRGIGSVLPFRWFAPPEILLLTLRSKK